MFISIPKIGKNDRDPRIYPNPNPAIRYWALFLVSSSFERSSSAMIVKKYKDIEMYTKK